MTPPYSQKGGLHLSAVLQPRNTSGASPLEWTLQGFPLPALCAVLFLGRERTCCLSVSHRPTPWLGEGQTPQLYRTLFTGRNKSSQKRVRVL